MSTQTSFAFEKLPREVRDKIYKIAVKATSDITIESEATALKAAVPLQVMYAKSPIIEILHLNRKIREEAIIVFYNLNEFHVAGKDSLISFINFVSVTGSKNIRQLCIGTSQPEDRKLHQNSEDPVHVDMISKLFCLTAPTDKRYPIPQHSGLDQTIASLATWGQLQYLRVDYSYPFSKLWPSKFSDIENDYLHLLCLFKQYRQMGILTLTNGTGTFGWEKPGGKPFYGIHAWGAGEPRNGRLRWLYDEVLQILRECGYDARKDERGFGPRPVLTFYGGDLSSYGYGPH